ncbi:MAG: MnmC family methyltransferase [Campylobacterota bacterium]|nr:MnmC family methyltransferase [Campylobacterota bacterium]
MTLSDDGSYTAYSKEYDEHYHSTKDGALYESLVKHIEPAFKVKKNLDNIYILDICYGLGFNTLTTLYYHKQNSLNSKLYIYSPELDSSLVTSLINFEYPEEFEEFRVIIETLSQEGVYEDDTFYIEIFLGDAREYIQRFQNSFDIVYQDAFSPSSNPTLWTQEYFRDIKKSMKYDGVLTTYSIALATRLALYENGFYIYLNVGNSYRDATVASLSKLTQFKVVDIQHKIACNPKAKSLRD